MKKIFSIYSTALLLLGLTSCNDYLDTVPSKGENEVITRGEQIQALFDNNETFNILESMTITESDDYGMTTDIYDQLGYLGEACFNGIAFDIDGPQNQPYGDEGLTREYNRVFKANLVINSIDDVTDISDAERQQYLAQAHFLRAMAEWDLVNTYAMPYSEQTKDLPGITLKTSTNYEEDMTRATIGETYAAIREDLEYAYANTTSSDVQDRWMVSRPAAAAMLARLSLFMQDYAAAEKYAAEALLSTQATLDDYNDLSVTEMDVTSPDGEPAVATYSELYMMGKNGVTTYKENYFTQLADVKVGALYPSVALKALYDRDNDLRFQQFFGLNTMYEQNCSDYGDNIVYHKFFDNLYMEDLIQTGPTVPEMILTKAEAEARQGNVATAMTTVNTLRQARMKADADDVTLTADNQEEAVMAILDERHREMPFYMRWQDIRRLNFNDVAYDDVTVSHTFYGVSNNAIDDSGVFTYTLPVQSYRFAQPIPTIEIQRSKGQIVQNEYPDGSVVMTAVESDNNVESNDESDEE